MEATENDIYPGSGSQFNSDENLQVVSPSPTTTQPSWLGSCPLSILRGTLLGAALGSGFHVIGGGIVRSQGRSTLEPKHIAVEAGKASIRLGTVFAGYTALRCSFLHLTNQSELLSCGLAGGIAVAVPTALDKGRVKFLQEYYGAILRSKTQKGGVGAVAAAGKGIVPMPAHFILVTAAYSGAMLLGGTDVLLHRWFGLRW